MIPDTHEGQAGSQTTTRAHYHHLCCLLMVIITILNNRHSKKTKKVEPSPAIAAAIPLLSYWIIKYISNDLELSSKCLDHEIIGKSIEEILDGIEGADDFQEELLESTERLTNLLVNLIGRQQKIKEDRPTPKAFEDSKDSVHGDDVVRRSREKIRYFIKISKMGEVIGF